MWGASLQAEGVPTEATSRGQWACVNPDVSLSRSSAITTQTCTCEGPGPPLHPTWLHPSSFQAVSDGQDDRLGRERALRWQPGYPASLDEASLLEASATPWTDFFQEVCSTSDTSTLASPSSSWSSEWSGGPVFKAVSFFNKWIVDPSEKLLAALGFPCSMVFDVCADVGSPRCGPPPSPRS